MAALPVNRRGRVAMPYVDPAGEYFITPRIAARKSVVDNTAAVFDARTGALLLKTTPHTPLRGIYNNSHPATPLTLGDFQVMKGWKGNIEGNTEDEVIDIGTGKVLVCDLDLTGPNVFVKGDDEVVLLAEPEVEHTLLDDYTVEISRRRSARRRTRIPTGRPTASCR